MYFCSFNFNIFNFKFNSLQQAACTFAIIFFLIA